MQLGRTARRKGCRDARAGGIQQTQVVHCRDTTITELMKSAAGQSCIEQVEKRKAKKVTIFTDLEGRAPVKQLRPPEGSVGPSVEQVGGGRGCTHAEGQAPERPMRAPEGPVHPNVWIGAAAKAPS